MQTWSTFQVLVFMSQLYTALTSLEPKFDQPMMNVTIKEKSTAVLPCSVSSLGNYQVVWTDQFSTLLTYQDRRIIDDERLSVERPYTRDWNLHIRDVRYSDQGIYHCQINTTPVKVKTINLIVLVPAVILDHLSTSDVTVREGDTVTLVCNVTGTPQPTVTWYRLVADSKGVEKQKVGINGEVLIIHNVTRFCGDSYECVAFNGVPPAVSRTIEVFVEFAPEIYLPNRRIGQEKGKETILECTVTAFPHAVTMWQKDGVKITTSTLKYRVEVYDEDKNRLTLSLRVFNIQESDFGTYTCVASNPLGDDEETMYLYDYSEHTKTTTTTRKTSSTAVNLYIPATHSPKTKYPPVVRLQPTASSDKHVGHNMEHSMGSAGASRPVGAGGSGAASRGQVTQRPVYTPPYRSGENSDNTRILASEDRDNKAANNKTMSMWAVALPSAIFLLYFCLSQLS